MINANGFTGNSFIPHRAEQIANATASQIHGIPPFQSSLNGLLKGVYG